MAMMINCATDWTFDIFAADMEAVKALPLPKGVRPAKNLTEGQKFAQYVKTYFKFADFGEHRCVDYNMSQLLRDMNFSDWYKDVYGQRPHFDAYLVGALCGVHGAKYGIASFCSHPVDNAKRHSAWVREQLDKAYEQLEA